MYDQNLLSAHKSIHSIPTKMESFKDIFFGKQFWETFPSIYTIKWIVCKGVSFSNGPFAGSMLFFGGVSCELVMNFPKPKLLRGLISYRTWKLPKGGLVGAMKNQY